MNKKPVIRMQVRYKNEIHQWLTLRAAKNNRSLNGELIDILIRTIETESQAANKAVTITN